MQWNDSIATNKSFVIEWGRRSEDGRFCFQLFLRVSLKCIIFQRVDFYKLLLFKDVTFVFLIFSLPKTGFSIFLGSNNHSSPGAC